MKEFEDSALDRHQRRKNSMGVRDIKTRAPGVRHAPKPEKNEKKDDKQDKDKAKEKKQARYI